MEDVWLAADRRRADRMASTALLADHAGVALVLEPITDVENGEDLELGGLAAHVEGVVVGRGPGFVAGVLRVRLAANRGGQVVVEVGDRPRRHRGTGHRLL